MLVMIAAFVVTVLVVYLILMVLLLLLAWGFHNTVERLQEKLLSRF